MTPERPDDDAALRPPLGGGEEPRYDRGEEIARGGMGVIFRVHDRQLDRTLAMKVALRGARDADATPSKLDVTRFVEEARVTAQLDHPGVIPVHELGFDGEHHYFTMKLVKGRELGDVFDLARAGEEGWNLARAIGVLVTVCQTVAYAHAKRVVHRDLKPANIMVGRFGEVHVMDWGLAKVHGVEDPCERRVRQSPDFSFRSIHTERPTDYDSSHDSSLVTMDGSILGTPAYMPPEQAKGHLDELDARSDIYSIGAILYRLLVGHAPYSPPDDKPTATAIVALVIQGPPPPVTELAPHAPPELVAICEKAMRRAPTDRYSSCLDLAEDLQAWLDGRVVGAYAAGAFAELRAWVRRNRTAAATIAAALLLAVAGATVFQVQQAKAAERVAAERDRAQSALVGLHANTGMRLADEGESADAALFFAQAARLSDDPVQRAQNMRRARSWLDSVPKLLGVTVLPGSVGGVEFHPDGRHVLSRSLSWSRWSLCDVVEGSAVPFEVVDDPNVTIACFDPSGEFLAVGTSEGIVRVVRFPSEEAVAEWAHESGVTALEFAPDAGLLASGSDVLELHDFETGESVGGKAPHPVWISWIRFSPDGKWIVTTCSGDDPSARVFARRGADRWDPTYAQGAFPVANLRATLRTPAPSFLATSGELILAADQSLSLRDLTRAEQREIRVGPRLGRIKGALSLPDSDVVLVYGSLGVQAWDSKSGASVGDFVSISDVEDLVLTPDGTRAVSAGSDGFVHFLDAPTWGEHVMPLRHQQGVGAVAISPDGERVVTAQPDGGIVRHWSIEKPADFGDFRLARIEADFLDSPTNLSGDGRLVMPAGWNTSRIDQTATRVFDVRTGEPVGPVIEPHAVVHAAALSSDGEQAAVLCSSVDGMRGHWPDIYEGEAIPGRIHVVWSRTGVPITNPIETPAEPLGGAFHPGGRQLAVVLTDGRVLVVRLPTGEVQEVGTMSGRVGVSHTQRDRVRFSRDGRVAVTWAHGPGAYVWDTADWTLRHRLADDRRIIDVHFSPDDSLLSVAAGATVEVFDVSTGSLTAAPLLLPDRAFRARFSADGALLMVACRDRFGRIWNWRDGELAIPPLDHGDEVFDVGFSADGSVAYTCGGWVGNSELRAWSVLDGLPLRPPHVLDGKCYFMPITDEGLAVLGTYGKIEVVDLEAFVRSGPDQDGDRLLLEAEVISGRRLLPGGRALNLTVAEWLDRYRAWRSPAGSTGR